MDMIKKDPPDRQEKRESPISSHFPMMYKYNYAPSIIKESQYNVQYNCTLLLRRFFTRRPQLSRPAFIVLSDPSISYMKR